MKINRFFFVLLVLMMLFPMFEAEASSTGEQKVITEFETFDINEHALNLMIGYKPSLEELCEMMPDTLGVYLDDSADVEEIAVEWYCVGENYEESEHFYFQFSPSWDEDAYVLSEEIELLTEAPYIAVFFRAEQDMIATAAVTNNSNEVVIFKYLTETLGYNTAAACGAMANIFCESSFIPNNLQDSYEKKLGFTNASYTAAVDSGSYKNFVNDAAGYGLCQWTYNTRKQGLLNLAKSMKVSIGDAKMQLKFLGQELNACATGKYMKSIANSDQGAYDVGYYYCQKFERPYQKKDEVSIYRGNLAKNTYWKEYGQIDMSKVTSIFPDVKKGSWYVDAIQYVYDHGLMSGSQGLFKPDGNVTRAQVISTLYQLDGAPKVTDYKACEELKDIKKSDWYADAVCWAYNAGLASGIGETKMFQGNAAVKRQQLAVFFYNYAAYKGRDITKTTDISKMLNADKLSPYAENAMKWMIAADIMSGSRILNLDGSVVYDLNPTGTATRAQLASILQNFTKTK